MGIKSNQRGGAGSMYGLSDNVNMFSAKTRKGDPNAPDATGATGSQASFNVMNNPTSAQGTTIGQVKSDYKTARKSGLSPDDARGVALTKDQRNVKFAKDVKGNAVP